MNPSEILLEGSGILRPVLCNHGFTFHLVGSGTGSGGKFAIGRFSHGDRKLELHYRHSLGLVAYWIGDSSASHQTYMRVLGASRPQYPGYSDNPLDGFRHLAHDLKHYAVDFLEGTGEALARAASEEKAAESLRSLDFMAQSVGDIRLRQQAKRLFGAKNYAGAVAVFEQVEYPELLSESEKAMLRIARARL